MDADAYFVIGWYYFLSFADFDRSGTGMDYSLHVGLPLALVKLSVVGGLTYKYL
ncbi:hypothetical protein HALLA_02805 (plasmid) [Halostagnicola larsenii XH-48]|uniref:Uncharacterized protein n=1 Tax=Halostagnicola larsenii XH-48 TaxID=797299 RepID=W0JRW9_9EURY|nr:hypothetical protein HALLA_02805 [Halostagnicola larsenii XH-48]